MPRDSELYGRLDSRWKATCRLFFGREIGGLEEYEGWLKEDLEPLSARHSTKTGKEVASIGPYQKNVQFISFDELDYNRKFEPLSINEIKDIDSVVSALGERAVYCGNVVLGNSSHVAESTGMEDSNFVLGCHTMHKCQDLAYCTIGREVRDSFGSSLIGESGFAIKGHNVWRTSRCFCSYRIYESNDIAYSNYLNGCSDCMFCFGMKGKRHMIGNAPLTAEKCLEVRRKLMAEIADELERKGRAIGFLDIAPKTPLRLAQQLQKTEPVRFDEAKVQEAFDETCALVFGKKLGSVRGYRNYLTRNIRGVRSRMSAVSKNIVYVGDYAIYRALADSGRLVKLAEFEEICQERKWPAEIRPESLKMENLGALLDPIAVYTTEEDSFASNTAESSTVHYAANILGCNRAYHAKDCAYSSWPRDADHMFGCESTRNSSFCIGCYYSWKLSRCFECDTSQNCTGSYFLHNCENVHDSLFCFNAKNLRYAVANAEVGREEFLRLKSLLLSEIVRSLEKTGSYARSIYAIGGR